MPRAARPHVTLPRPQWRHFVRGLLLGVLASVSIAGARANSAAPATGTRRIASAGTDSGDAHPYRRRFYFLRLDSRAGLVQNSVSLLHQDQTGYMWLATQGGLFRYDGYTLRRYTHDPDRADSLPEDFLVTALADAEGGKLWVGTLNSGLLLFDPIAGRTLPVPAATQRPNLPVASLLRLANGDLLIGTTHGLDRLAGGAKSALTPLWREATGGNDWVHGLTLCPDGGVFAYAGDEVLSVGDGQRTATVLAQHNPVPIDALYCGPDNRLLLGDRRGLANVARDTGAQTPIWKTTGDAAGVRAIVTDHAGHVWLALDDHTLLRLGPGSDQIHVAPAPVGIPGGLPDARIDTLLVDRTGMLWAGTATAGAIRAQPDGSPIESVLDLTGDPRAHTYVRAFLAAPDGQWWIAINGPGLVRYNPGDGSITRFGQALASAVAQGNGDATRGSERLPRSLTRADSASPRIYAIVRAADGALLLPSNHGLLRFDPATGKADFLTIDGAPFTTPVRALLRARDGDLWIAPFDSGLVRVHAGRIVQRYGRAQGLAADLAVSLAEDKLGDIWAGTSDGLSRIDPTTGKIQSFRETPGKPDSLAGRMVVSLLVTRAGDVWAGSLSGVSRLVKVDATGGHFRRYGRADGLPDATGDCMLEDARGDVWISTNLGIGRLDPHTGDVRSFSTADGLQGSEYNTGACLALADGKLLFGGTGFDIIDPARVHASRTAAPVVLTRLYAGNHDIPPAASISLPAGAGTFYAAFAALDFTAPENARFRYRLLGRDDAWSAPTHDHFVTYANLAPGDYTLQVQAIRRDGSVGQAAALAVHVAAPWWATRSMHALYAILAALLATLGLLVWHRQHKARLQHRQQLLLRENRLRHALWGSGDEFWDLNLARGTLLRLGPAGQPGGHREDSIPFDTWRTTVVHPDDLPKVDAALAEHLAGHSEHFEIEHRERGRDGKWTWVLSRGKVVERDAEGKPARVSGTSRDVSAIRNADRDRRIATEVIRNMTEAVIVTDLEFRFFSVNTAFTRMTGYAEQEVLGHDVGVLNGSRHAAETLAQMNAAMADSGHWRGELWQRRKDGEEFLCWVEWSEVCDDSHRRTHLIGVFTDITERKRAEQELRYLANYDTLTGLPNRALLGERLGAAVISARRAGNKVGLLFLDLDRFKHVNDSLGHTAGDRTLKAAGARLRQNVHESDVVARLGGDEFTIVLESIDDVQTAEGVARRLIQAFVKPLQVSGNQETVLSPSIGIALYPDHGQTPAELLQCADTAMYQAKAGGRNTWVVYNPAMDAHARNHAILVNALRRALERNELRLAYQPKMSLAGDSITGMEALLRWHHSELGEISPDVFIPLAEETGQIHEISAFVFATACADLRRFRDSGHRNLVMAINLSAAQLNRPDITSHICDLLAEHDIAPNQVELELTESMVMANAEESVRLLGELKSVGTRLAIDDFGTGYSSLAYLKRLPIDTLKIDQAFVGDITTDPDDAAITATIITLAHALEVQVVAEGVETAEQLAFLRAQACDEIQGYWLSRPLSADACLEFLDRHATTAGSVA